MKDENRTGGSPIARHLGVSAVIFGASAVLGSLLGLLWWVIAPRSEGMSLGDGQVFSGTTEDVFAGEGYFVLMTAVAGLVTGYLVYMVQFPLSRRRMQDLRLTGLIAGVVGSIVATVLVWQVGVLLDGPVHAEVASAEAGEKITVGLQLEATAFLVVWPFVFVLQYGLLEAIGLTRRDLPGVVLPDPARAPGAERHSTEWVTVGPTDENTTADNDTGGPESNSPGTDREP